MKTPAAICLDVGSTFTKAAAIDLVTGALLGTATHRTTIGTDVLDGIDACVAALREALRGEQPGEILACSSAGGGLRLAVVGHERVVTAEAGYRVGLSAGARVVHVAAGRLTPADVTALCEAAPDVVLLVGGTDGGNADVLLHNAAALAAAPAVPIVLAGNAAAAADAQSRLGAHPVVVAANVLPRIGVLNPAPARAAIREVFLRHVIGGKGLSTGTRFTDMVAGATPDLVLAGVELLADTLGDVVLVDVGGATTDVYSALTPDPEESSLRREVVEVLWRSRTVEGDLGVRWNAPGIVAAAHAERLVDADEAATLDAPARRRADDPGFLAADAAERAVDQRLAELAVTVALRRHARPEQRADGTRHSGRDLRQARLFLGSGGVLRHGTGGTAVLEFARHDHAGGWLAPIDARLAVDTHSVLAAAGLLARDHPRAATLLLTGTFALTR